MVCIRCQKRPAIIFIQRMENGQMKQEGYCLHCARELHIKPVDDLMKQFGMSEQDLDNMENRMESMMEELGDSNPLSMLMNMSGSGEDADAENMDEDLVPGSNATFPLGFTGTEKQDGDKKADRKNGKKPPKRKFLDTYCENLTRKAREGKLDDIIGRDREIYRTIQILSRRQKNNPCLIGEAGVGKTAIAEGIAERIAKGQVPIGLRDKEIFLLDLTSLVAGTQFRGQFEQRVKGLLSEVKAIQRMENGQMKQEGYCLHCARELHIKPVDDLMKQFGMSEQDLDNMENRMESMMEELGDSNPLSMLMNMSGSGEDADAENMDEDLVPGSNATFPLGFTGTEKQDGDKKADRKNGKKPPKRKFLDTYCENLTRKAREGKLDDIIGRDREIYRTIQILSRRQKNNPCLIGEAGVGKTAIAEGIAERIAKGQVPIGLRDKEIFLLDLTSLVAGTQFRGQFEQRVKGLLSEVKAAGNVILFIDEIHTITSAGESEGAMNAGNILKPALSRGEIQVIGATTFTEYRKYIEKDQALERRFQPVRVEEPSVADTLAVMNGIKRYYEQHHHVQVPAEVLSAVVTLSERYITDRFLPDKAIDLLDEACACCNLAHPVISEYLGMQKELDALKQEEAEMESADVNEAIDYERVAERKTRIAKLESELPAKQAAASEIQVTMDDVAKVIELWTGIPAVKIRETEFVKLAGLENALKQKVIGQDEAVHLVAQAIKRSRADLSGRRRPASFIFVGPTGVGKTELVKQLAEQLFDGPDPLIRLDMSEYMEKYAVSRMIGSPPGYVGYEEAGQLTEKVRRRPYSVVLFDEIEKAHPDVMNILLQILDEGKINDAQGRTVDFSNTVICMTSNAGSSDQSAGSLGFNKSDAQRSEEKTRKALAQFLRPEFLGRVDEVIAFKPLTEETLQGIAALMLDEYKPGMEAKGIAYSYTPAALKALVQKSQGGRFGARDLRRTIRKAVEDPAAERLIDGTLASGGTLVVDADENGEVVLK